MKLRDKLKKLTDDAARSKFAALTERRAELEAKLRGGGGIVMRDDALRGAEASVRRARQQFEQHVRANLGAGQRDGYDGRLAQSDIWVEAATLFVLSRPEFASEIVRLIESAERPGHPLRSDTEWAAYTRDEVEAELAEVRREHAALELDVQRRDAEQRARDAAVEAEQLAARIDESIDAVEAAK